ncbi:MAG: MlaD family protein [Gemmatimonas sp.]|jgi:phospholipid/cholesterol/gamma-HCH transport system substrate-binding protein|nr:MlaD family protein [Gemmatimonadaceae bacterium]
MKRSTFITWDQLKVGGLILVAIAILTIAVVKLGEAADLFTKRYTLVTFLSNSNGLQKGGTVTLAGQLAGNVKQIDFLPPSGDTTRNLRVTLEVEERLHKLIREDSRIKLKSLGLLGDKVLDITPGTPRFGILPAGDTIQSLPSLDYEAMLTQANGALTDVVQLTHDLRSITGGIAHGDGTMGQLINSRTMYDQLNGTLTHLNGVLTRLDRPNGTFGRMVDDPALYNHLVDVTAQLDTVLAQLHSPHSSVGRLLTDDTLYTHMVAVTSQADSLLRALSSTNGTAGRIINDPALYDKLNKSLTDLSAILEDVRKNPRKYTKGMVKVF